MPFAARRALIPPLALAFALLLPPASASAQTTWPAPTLESPARKASPPLSQLKGGGALGLGLVAGTVNGLAMKIWPTRAHAIALHVGGAARVDTLSADVGYRFHFRPVGDDVTVQAYLGAEFRLRLAGLGDGQVYTELAAGVPIGISVLKSGLPAELFVEAAPLAVFHEVPGFDVAGLSGVRLYF